MGFSQKWLFLKDKILSENLGYAIALPRVTVHFLKKASAEPQRKEPEPQMGL